MSRNMIQVFLYELRRGLQRRGYLFSTFGIPILALLAIRVLPTLTAISAQEVAESVMQNPERFNMSVGQIGYVDLSGFFVDVSAPSGITAYADETAARAALDSGEIEGYYLIAPDYLETGDVTLVMPSLQINSMDDDAFEPLALAALTRDIDPDIAARLTRPPRFTEINLSLLGSEENGGMDEDTTFLVVYIFALGLLLSLFFTNGYLLQTVIEEKETRLIEILLSSVRPGELLIGKILAMGLLGLLQMVAWVGGALLAIRFAAGGADLAPILAQIAVIQIPTGILPIIAVYFVLAYLLFAALYGIVGALSNSMREGPQYAVVFTIPAVFPLYFIPLFTSAPDGTLPTILSLIPITAPLAMIQRLVISDVPAWQIALSLALLAVAGVVALWLAGRVFRMQTLLAGQMIKLRELPRLLRG